MDIPLRKKASSDKLGLFVNKKICKLMTVKIKIAKDLYGILKL